MWKGARHLVHSLAVLRHWRRLQWDWPRRPDPGCPERQQRCSGGGIGSHPHASMATETQAHPAQRALTSYHRCRFSRTGFANSCGSAVRLDATGKVGCYRPQTVACSYATWTGGAGARLPCSGQHQANMVQRLCEAALHPATALQHGRCCRSLTLPKQVRVNQRKAECVTTAILFSGRCGSGWAARWQPQCWRAQCGCTPRDGHCNQTPCSRTGTMPLPAAPAQVHSAQHRHLPDLTHVESTQPPTRVCPNAAGKTPAPARHDACRHPLACMSQLRKSKPRTTTLDSLSICPASQLASSSLAIRLQGQGRIISFYIISSLGSVMGWPTVLPACALSAAACCWAASVACVWRPVVRQTMLRQHASGSKPLSTACTQGPLGSTQWLTQNPT